MLDKTMDGALLALRKQIIREGKPGLEHVEALLTLRGVPMPRVLPAKRKDAAKRGQMRRLVLSALREGPRTMRELAGYIGERRPELSERAAYVRATQALQKMKAAGLVRLENRMGRYVWGLA